MAYKLFSPSEARSHIKIDLSTQSINKTIEALKMAEVELQSKCDEFCHRMAELGAGWAQYEIHEYKAEDTLTLLNSIQIEPGDVIPNGASWIIYTDCPYAQFVEYGTGPIGSMNPHPDGRGNYRSTPWTYFNPRYKKWVKTSGMESRPFMFNTWEYLQQDKIIREVAKEVFG